jgi:NTE family protein
VGDPESLIIGVALSGGGVRAAVFHLGVLLRLAADGLLERVTFLSTVSGGSMGVGLAYSLAGGRWPASASFGAEVLPRARQILTTVSIQKDYLWRSARQPWLLFGGRARLVSQSMQARWDLSGRLQDVPETPRWIINATTYETGKNWRTRVSSPF